MAFHQSFYKFFRQQQQQHKKNETNFVHLYVHKVHDKRDMQNILTLLSHHLVCFGFTHNLHTKHQVCPKGLYIYLNIVLFYVKTLLLAITHLFAFILFLRHFFLFPINFAQRSSSFILFFFFLS